MSKTCGPMYLEALTKYAGSDPTLVRAFAAGFVNGQAEKVYLGACKAAMFRPSKQWVSLINELATDAADRYNLDLFEAGRGEVWLCRSMEVWEELRHMHTHVGIDSPTWHRRRGELCGIPANEIDEEFHKRKGYGEPCDIVAERTGP